MKRLVSFVISAFNEELCIRELGRRLREFMSRHSRYDFEVIFVDHGSTDRTFELMNRVHEADPRFKIVQLSKNFGIVDYGYSAGMAYASGDAVVLMNADLQDPPDVVAKFLERWEAGYDIVYGIILKREGVSLIRKIISPLFYEFMSKLTDGQMPKNATDFRLIDRKVYEQIRQMPEHNRFMRAMIAWTGFRQVGVPFVRASRFAQGSEGGGARDFNVFTFVSKTMRIINNAVYSFSDFPIKVMGVVGLISLLGSAFAGLFYLAFFLITGKAGPLYATGFTPVILVMFFLFGLLSSFMSMLGEYITRIYEETKQRPIFIVRKTIGFNTKKD